jgi:hypothetical protein
MVAGWKIKVLTRGRAGNPAIIEYYLAFEGDKELAVALVRRHLSLNASARIEAIAPAGGHLFYRREMKAGNVKRYVSRSSE